jgi:hypothetical protein
MNILKTFIILLIIPLISFHAVAKDREKRDSGFLQQKKQKMKIKCIAVTNRRAICSDLKCRSIKHMNNANKKNALNTTPFKCASQGKLKYSSSGRQEASSLAKIALKLNTCKVVSDFCAICPNGKYLFTKTGEEISSDPYECITSPRTQHGVF